MSIAPSPLEFNLLLAKAPSRAGSYQKAKRLEPCQASESRMNRLPTFLMKLFASCRQRLLHKACGIKYLACSTLAGS